VEKQTSQIYKTSEVSVQTFLKRIAVTTLPPLCPSLKGGGENGITSINV